MSNFLDKILQIIAIDPDQSRFIKKGMSGTLAMEIFAKVILFVITLLLTNYLTADDYGRYSYLMGILISLATFATFGLDDLLVKKMGVSDRSANDFNRPGLLWSIVLAIVVSIGFVFFSDRGVVSLYIGGATILLTIQYMISSILKGRRHILSAQAPEQIIRLGSFLALILVQLFWLASYSLESIARAIFVSGLLSCLVSIFVLFKKERLDFILPKSSGFSLFRSEVLFFAALSLFGVFRHKLDVLILGWNELFVETGIYNICSKLSDFILIGLVLTNALYMPLFATQNDNPDKTRLAKVLKSSSVINMILGGVLLVIYLIFGNIILGLFGDGFEAGYSALIVLSISTLLYSILGPYIIMLMMVGYAKDVLIGLVIGVSLQFVLAIILIDGDPIMGMAISKGVSIVFIQIFMMIAAWKRLGLEPFFLLTKDKDK